MEKDIKNDNIYQDGNTYINPRLLEKMDNYHHETQMSEKNDYQNAVTSYINRKFENSIKKDYNPKIVNLYENGILAINNEEYRLRDFFIVFDSEKNNYHLKCINPKFKSEEIDYNCAIRFIDSTAFVNLINSSRIIDNRIILEDIDNLNTIVSNWDGFLHSEVLETDSILNKRMIK